MGGMGCKSYRSSKRGSGSQLEESGRQGLGKDVKLEQMEQGKVVADWKDGMGLCTSARLAWR